MISDFVFFLCKLREHSLSRWRQKEDCSCDLQRKLADPTQPQLPEWQIYIATRIAQSKKKEKAQLQHPHH